MADRVGGVYIEIQARMGSLEKDLRLLQEKMQQTDKSGMSLSESFRRIEQSANLFGSKATELASKNAVLRQKMEELIAKGIDPSNKGFAKLKQQYDENQKAIDGLNKKVNSSSNSFMNFYKVIVGSAIAYKIYEIGKSALSASAAMEQNRVAFTTMLGSAEKAKTLLTEMQNFAGSTPFEFTEIAEAGKKMIAFGFSSGEVVEKLRALGDVSAGLGVPLNDMAYLFGQIKTQGRAMTQDLNQFAARGIPIYEELGKVLGMDAESVKDFASTGKIAFKDIDQVFKNLTKEGGKFAGLMDAQSKTLAGRWSNFNDQLNKSLVILGDQMAPTAGSILSIFTKLLENDNLRSEKAKESYEVEIKRLQAQGEYGEAYLRQNGYIATFLNMLDGTMEKEIALAKFKNQQVTSEFEQRQSFQERDKALMEKNGDAEKKQIVSTVKAGKDKWKALKDEAKKYYDAVQDISTSTDDPVKKVENEIAALNEGMNKVSDMYKNGEIKKKQYEDTLASYSEARIKKEEELEQAKFDKIASMYSAAMGVATTFSGQLAQLSQMSASNRTAEIDNELQHQQDALQEKYDNDVEAINNSIASQSEKDARLKALDEQKARDDKALATKADKEKRKIAREAAKQQKALSMFDILITTPQAALNAFTGLAKYNIIAAGVAAAAATGLGLAQLKLVADQPLPALAEGGIVPAIPGGRTVKVAEAGSSEAVIPLNDRGVEVIKNIIGTAEPQVNLHVYINDDYKGLYKASKDGYVTIDKRAVV